MTVAIQPLVTVTGLKHRKPYTLSWEWVGAGGTGTEGGYSAETTDANGSASWPAFPTLISAIDRAPGPGTLTLAVTDESGTVVASEAFSG